MRACAPFLLAAACASAPPRGAPTPEAAWSGEERAALELLRELTSADTTRRAGRARALAALARTLEAGGIPIEAQDELVAARWPRRRGALEAAPILLVAHVDASEASALGEDLARGELVGAGLLGGRGAAAVFASGLRALARSGVEPPTPIWLVVTADGLDPTGPSLVRALGRFPALARARLAWVPGGHGLRTHGPTLRVVASGETGYAALLVTAVGPDAAYRLAEAITQVPGALPRPSIGYAARRYLSDRAAAASWPESWLLEAGPLTELVYTEPLARDPVTRRLVAPEAHVRFLDPASRPGASGVGARVDVLIPESETPSGLRARLRAKMAEAVHVDILAGEPVVLAASGSKAAAARLAEALGGGPWVRVLAAPSQARLLHRIRIPTLGLLPVELEPSHAATLGTAAERLPREELRAAVGRVARALVALGVRTSTSPLARGSSPWQTSAHEFRSGP